MKRLVLYISILLVGLYTASCKKEHLTQTNNSPVFYFTGSVGGVSVNLQAGVNDYYMYSSYTQDSNNVYNYIGNLKEYNCSSSCPPSIQFIINDYRNVGKGAQEVEIDSTLTANNYCYYGAGGTPTSYYVNFLPQLPTNIVATNYTYTFGDGSTLTGIGIDSTTHLYSHPGNYITALSVTFDSGSTSTLTKPISVATGNASLSYLLSANPTGADSGLQFSFHDSITGGTTPINYTWNFGDPLSVAANSATGSYPTHTFSSQGQYMVTVTATDANSYVSIATTNLVTAGYGNSDIVNYTAHPVLSLPNPKGFSNVTVIYTDASGHKYSSANVTQPINSNMQIISVSSYQNNINNQPTKQLHIKFNCMVSDSNGNSQTINNGNAVIAVAYK